MLLDGRAIAEPAGGALALLARAALFCNNARLLSPNGTQHAWAVVGDPTEGALLVMAAKAGVNLTAALDETPRLWEIPFDSARKRMTTVQREPDGVVAYVKGSPTGVLDLCRWTLLDQEPVKLTAAPPPGMDRAQRYARPPSTAHDRLRLPASASGCGRTRCDGD